MDFFRKSLMLRNLFFGPCMPLDATLTVDEQRIKNTSSWSVTSWIIIIQWWQPANPWSWNKKSHKKGPFFVEQKMDCLPNDHHVSRGPLLLWVCLAGGGFLPLRNPLSSQGFGPVPLVHAMRRPCANIFDRPGMGSPNTNSKLCKKTPLVPPHYVGWFK